MNNEKELIDSENKKSKDTASIRNKPSIDLLTLFNPPTELPLECMFGNKRSFIEGRRFAGKRAAEIVDKKYGGYDHITDEQLSQSFKQAWEERVAFCEALQQKNLVHSKRKIMKEKQS